MRSDSSFRVTSRDQLKLAHRKLLKELTYDPSHDKFIHVGDLIAKGSNDGSLKVLDFMATHNITGVRGNHDQKVIEWRAWMDWIQTLPGGRAYLRDLIPSASGSAKSESKGKKPVYDVDEKTASSNQAAAAGRPWWQRIPEDWRVNSDHFRIAYAMTPAQSKYLRSLPLVLHVPEAHVFLAHAGLLGHDPQYPASDRRQPLANPPNFGSKKPTDAESLRWMQEEALLNEVLPNMDPWVTLNMRGILHNSSVTR